MLTLKKTHSAVTNSVITEPRCLSQGEVRPPSFQGSFVSHGKWFRCPCGRREVRAPVHARRVRLGLIGIATSVSDAGSAPAWVIPSGRTNSSEKIDFEPVEQRLQFWPEPVTAESGDRVKLAHVVLPCLLEHGKRLRRRGHLTCL
jgi:hypothetical protein